MPSKVEKWKDEVYGNEIREHLMEFAEKAGTPFRKTSTTPGSSASNGGGCTTSVPARSRIS